VRALEECGGNQTRAAQMLGVSRRTLINRIEGFNLPRPKKR
jgi:DNA-binding protein Fis